jgi:hypothetical protein
MTATTEEEIVKRTGKRRDEARDRVLNDDGYSSVYVAKYLEIPLVSGIWNINSLHVGS